MNYLKHLSAALLLAGAVSLAHADATTDAIKEKLASALQEEVSKVEATPFSGLYQAVVDDKILYTNTDVSYIMAGSLVDVRAMKNLTAEAMTKIGGLTSFKDLPLQNSIKDVRGDGRRKILLFEDPNCVYCKTMTKVLKDLNDATLYIFMIPILTPDSSTKTRHIWCAGDKLAVWHDWMIDGKPIPEADCDADKLIQSNLELAQKLNITGTPTIFFENGRRIEGFAEMARFKELMNAPADEHPEAEQAQAETKRTEPAGQESESQDRRPSPSDTKKIKASDPKSEEPSLLDKLKGLFSS